MPTPLPTMPCPTAWLEIEQFQHNMVRLALHFEAVDPNNPERLLYNYVRVDFRHADSNYEGD